jgi:hypothetical protein
MTIRGLIEAVAQQQNDEAERWYAEAAKCRSEKQRMIRFARAAGHRDAANAILRALEGDA